MANTNDVLDGILGKRNEAPKKENNNPETKENDINNKILDIVGLDKKEKMSFWVDSANAAFLRSYSAKFGISQADVINALILMLQKQFQGELSVVEKRSKRRIGESVPDLKTT